MWGLELMVLLVKKGHMNPSDAERIAHDINLSNPHYNTDDILRRFAARIRGK